MFWKKFLIISILIILLINISSCKKQEDSFLGLSKVEITTNLFYELPRLELYIFSSKNYHNLSIDNKYIDYVNYQKQDINLVINELQVEGILHYFNITFIKEEFVLTKIKIKNQKDIYDVNIGLYQTILLEPSSLDINTSCSLYNNKGIINYQNNLYNPIYFKEVNNLTYSKNQSINLLNINQQVIYSKQLKSLDIFTYQIKEKYHQIGGIIKSSFYTNLEEYYTYSTYYFSTINNLLLKDIDTNELEIIY